MESRFVAKPLPEDQVMQAYPLIQSIEASLTPDQWQTYALNLSREPTAENGIVVIQGTGGYIHGIFTYQIVQDLVHGRTLKVDHLVAADLIGRMNVVAAIIGAIDELATEYLCNAQQVHLPDSSAISAAGRASLVELFVASGHQITGLGLCKNLSH